MSHIKRDEKLNCFLNSLKMCLEQNEANVQGNYRLLATEFINFLSSIMLCQN